MRLVVLSERQFVELSNKVRHDNQTHSELIIGRHLVFYGQDILVLCEPDFTVVDMQRYPEHLTVAEMVRYAHGYPR